jgi:hypothetical protein
MQHNLIRTAKDSNDEKQRNRSCLTSRSKQPQFA